MRNLTTEHAEQLARNLSNQNTPTAFVAHEGKVYFTRHTFARHEPASPIVNLIQAIYDTQPERALSIVRNRIYATYVPTEMCRGMLKVAGRRLTAPLVARDHGLSFAHACIQLTGLSEPSASAQARLPSPLAHPLELWGLPGSPCTDQDFMRLALNLAAAIPRPQARQFDRDRAIAALLISPQGECLGWGVNAISKNRTLHAELNAVQSYWRAHRRPLPAGTRVYTTLKPCRMCAGMLWQACEDPRSLVVRYAEFDPGPNARETVFNQPGLDIERKLQL